MNGTGYSISSKRGPRVDHRGGSEVSEAREGMSWTEAEDYVAEHYGQESAADMARATGHARQEIYQITFKLKKNGCIAADRESWGSTQGPSAATGKRQKVVPTAPPPPAGRVVRCEHKHWLTGPDAVIEGKYPDFFKDGSHAHLEHPYEWQVCQECDYAEPIRPKYPWDKGISVVLAPNQNGLHWPSPARPHEAASPEAGTVEVIEEPGSDVAGEVLLEAEGDPGDEQPQLAATTASPNATEEHPNEIVRLQTALAQAKSDVMLLRVDLNSKQEDLVKLQMELGKQYAKNDALYGELLEAKRQLRLEKLQGQLDDLELQASVVRREIAQLKEQAA